MSIASTEHAPSLSPDEVIKKDFEALLHGGVYDPYTGKVSPLPANLIPSAVHVPVSAGITPLIFDLTTAGTRSFTALIEAFNDQTLEMGQLPKLQIPNGWYCVGPAFLELLLRHNRPGANREASLGTVRYYFRQIRRKQWQPTGEPLILNQEDSFYNGQHRAWAGFLGGASFITYIVADTPVIPHGFAFYDNVKERTASVALKTAGLNGTAPLIAALINIAHNFEEGAYTCQKKRRTDRLSPIDVIEYVDSHPLAKRASHLTAGEYKGACEAVGHKDVVAFLVFKLLADFGEDVTDRFMEDIEFGNDDAPADHAGRAIRSFLAKQRKAADPLAKHLVLAHLIKGFNAWVEDQPLKTLKIALDDDFPAFVEPAEADSIA